MNVWLIIWVCLLTAVLLTGYIMTQNKRTDGLKGQLEGSMVIIQGNSLWPISPVYIPYTAIHSTLIDCLIKYESGGRINAVGKANEKGILQFKDATFKMFCVDKYGLGKNIWNPLTQRQCADNMIGDGLSFHWSTLSLCD